MIDAMWIQENLKEFGKTQADLAPVLGRHPSAVSRLLKESRNLKSSEEAAIRQYFEDLRVLKSGAPKVRPLPQHDLVKIIGIYGNVSAANGIIQGLSEPDGTRKLYLDVPEECFAVEVSGDSMEPRYRHGDKLLIHPTQTVIKGCDVLIRLPGGEGMIKTFKHEKAGIITYTQYFPKETDKTIKRSEIEGLQAVLCRWG